jgi:hypothetical protein
MVPFLCGTKTKIFEKEKKKKKEPGDNQRLTRG